MDISAGIHLLSRESPPCPACIELKRNLKKLGIDFIEHDVVKERMHIFSVPQLILNGTTVLIGSGSVEVLKRVLGLT